MTIYYPDISNFQAGIPLTNALAVVSKATEGTGYTSPDYVPSKGRAAKSGTYFCAYHFLLQGNAVGQAQHAHSVVGSTPLMLDWEPEPQINSFPTMTDAQEFIDEYRKLGGTIYLLYFPKWYWEQHLHSPSLKPMIDRGMLLVSSVYTQYTDASTGAGWQPYGGMTPTVWQYTSTLSFNGHQVDFNAFRGSYAGKQDAASIAACLKEFESLTKTGKLPVDPPNHPQVVVPNVTHEFVSDAEAVLTAHHLVPMTTAPADYIVAKTVPLAGATVEVGSKVAVEGQNWVYTPPQRLAVQAAGYTSVRLEWADPAGTNPAGVKAPEITTYQISVQKNGVDVTGYPRNVANAATATQVWQGGGLAQSTTYTAFVRALPASGHHASPWATVTFKTGKRRTGLGKIVARITAKLRG